MRPSATALRPVLRRISISPFNPTTATSARNSQVRRPAGGLFQGRRTPRAAAELKKLEAEFAKLPPGADRDLVLAYIRASLLELESVRSWEKNPDNYSSGITSSAFTIMSRKFAPPEVRLQVADRARAPDAQGAGGRTRQSEESAADLYRNRDRTASRRLVASSRSDVPLAFKDVKDPKLLADFKASNDAVIAALKDYEKFLKTDLLPRSNGDFRLGADNFSKKLLYEEMVDIPLDRLLRDRLRQPAREPAEVPRNRREDRSQRRRRSRFWRIWKTTIRRPDNLLDAFRDTCHQAARLYDRARRSSPFRRRCCRFSKRRRRSCAR